MPVTASASYQFTITTPRFDPDLLKALVIMATKETDLVYSPARRKIETNVRLFTTKPVCAIAVERNAGSIWPGSSPAFCSNNLAKTGSWLNAFLEKGYEA